MMKNIVRSSEGQNEYQLQWRKSEGKMKVGCRMLIENRRIERKLKVVSNCEG